MTDKIREVLEELIENLNANSYSRGLDWNGFEVYEPQYEKFGYRGMPWVILVKGQEVRLSTSDESLAYLDYKLTEEAKGKSINELKSEQTEETD